MTAHDYKKFAKEYASLEIKDSFYLAYRDIPDLIKKYVKGNKALDYGCGGGRSTRFLKKLDFSTIGVDISKEMISEAKKKDINGDYYLIKSGKLPFKNSSFDLAFISIVFIEISSKEEMICILKEIRRVLKRGGVAIIITGTPEGYTSNWSSFICDFPENRKLNSGDKAKLIIRGTSVVLYDYVWFDDDYKETFEKADLKLISKHYPMPNRDNSFKWYSESKKPLWVIYALKRD